MKLLSPWLLAYVATIVLVNIGFSHIPPIETQFGLFAPMALVVGGVFVLRDFAQRQAGHYVLVAMGIGALLSYAMASPYVAIASALAFAVSELVDWVIYSTTKKPFHERILWSSVVSTPIDTVVFLLGITAFSWGTFFVMIASKMVAAIVIWWIYNTEPTDFPNSSGFHPHW